MNEFEQIWKIYQESFPKDEKRNLSLQKQILKNPNYHIIPFYKENILVGFMATWELDWELDKFIFIEHYAMDKRYRGQGYGEKFLRDFLQKTSKRIVLEVEKPETSIAKRRIQFYQRLGFYCNPFNYVQPSYEQDQQPVPLLLMTYPDPVSKEIFQHIKDKLYREVYGTSLFF
ncbi:GNAT family N-acetyltransferase [Garciella nitratireducens]|uniref:Ribosomal protein S18 acetylase RimI n=1 Tax=Garciella nitratireducens DSM 15102 TaxID=1121911 RepID=A0A1T4PPC7_9FIRM|nr:GNAT family N-acetyltransferase [Garciella nitratireducens]SJZ93067.1 Ribosomal protein S18 acetylase RimI [Garciella nitratireducens DSM 15102]